MGDPSYHRWHEGRKSWFAQSHDSCCFVYAVANAMIAKGEEITDAQIQEACDIGCCRTGSVIGSAKVVKFFNAPLEPTDWPEEVLQRGGLLSICHPIINGHIFYVDQESHDEGSLRLINSWLGPTVMLNVGMREVRPYVSNRYGSHWVLKEV